jgi:hypothetical protein
MNCTSLLKRITSEPQARRALSLLSKIPPARTEARANSADKHALDIAMDAADLAAIGRAV